VYVGAFNWLQKAFCSSVTLKCCLVVFDGKAGEGGDWLLSVSDVKHHQEYTQNI
jgi:hypothetical protein